MKQIEKDFIIVSILFAILVVSYPLLMGAAYGLADQDDRVIPTIDGIKPVIDLLYLVALVLGGLTMGGILWCLYYDKDKKHVIIDGDKG